MIAITVQDDQVRAELRRIQAKLGDLTPAMAGIAMALETAVSDRFETEHIRLGRGTNPNISGRKSLGFLRHPNLRPLRFNGRESDHHDAVAVDVRLWGARHQRCGA
jgi:hypothetical protein